MDRKSLERLRLDRRLIRRRGWISERELEREIASLPDVSAKATLPAKDGGGPARPADAAAPSGTERES
jgi:hypothetical protein